MKHIIASVLLIFSFYLGVYNSRLAIYDAESGKALVILPYNIEIYPADDQQRLQEGIPFDTPQELSALLEDYMS